MDKKDKKFKQDGIFRVWKAKDYVEHKKKIEEQRRLYKDGEISETQMLDNIYAIEQGEM